MSNEEKRPDWLEIAQEQLAKRQRPKVQDSWPRLPEPGEIHIVEAMDGRSLEPRMACVLAVAPNTGSAEVALVSHEIDLATDRDLPLPAKDSGLPFDLLVETDVVARVWLIQLGRLVVRLRADRIDSVIRVVMGGQEPATDTVLPIQGTADPRSVFKEEEGAALDALAQDCSLHLEGARRVPIVVDPAVLVRADREPADRHLGRLVATAQQLLASETRIVPERSLDWLPRLGDGDCDTLRALTPMFEAALHESTSRVTDAIRFDPEREVETDQDDELGALLPPLIEANTRSLLLLTIGDAWSGGMGAPTIMATATVGDHGPLQIVRHDVEEAC